MIPLTPSGCLLVCGGVHTMCACVWGHVSLSCVCTFLSWAGVPIPLGLPQVCVWLWVPASRLCLCPPVCHPCLCPCLCLARPPSLCVYLCHQVREDWSPQGSVSRSHGHSLRSRERKHKSGWWGCRCQPPESTLGAECLVSPGSHPHAPAWTEPRACPGSLRAFPVSTQPLLLPRSHRFRFHLLYTHARLLSLAILSPLPIPLLSSKPTLCLPGAESCRDLVVVDLLPSKTWDLASGLRVRQVGSSPLARSHSEERAMSAAARGWWWSPGTSVGQTKAFGDFFVQAGNIRFRKGVRRQITMNPPVSGG